LELVLFTTGAVMMVQPKDVSRTSDAMR
jgi:hypothetical protein